METTHSSPKSFGRFTAIMKDHERLRVTLRQLGEMCTALESRELALPPELQPVPLLRDLQAELSQHFAKEEAPAYFGTIVLERPASAHKIAELTSEHKTMLQAISELNAIAADGARWSELSTPTRGLVAQLRNHEHAENELLQDHFLRDDGTASE